MPGASRLFLFPRPFQNLSELAFDRFNFNPAACFSGRRARERRDLLVRAKMIRFYRRGGDRLRHRWFHGFIVRRFGSFTWDVPVEPAIQPGTIPLKAPHSMLATGFDRGNDFEEVAIANKVFHGVSGHENLTLG